MSYLAPGHEPVNPHPFANLFPPLASAAREELVRSLLSEGQRQPIILHEGMILIGRARYELLTALRRRVEFRELAKGDARALKLVALANLPRLSEGQRATVLKKITQLLAAPTLKPLLQAIRKKYGAAA